ILLSFVISFSDLSVFCPKFPSFATFTFSLTVLTSSPRSPFDKLFDATLTDDLLLVSFVFVSSVCFSSVTCSVLFAFFSSVVCPLYAEASLRSTDDKAAEVTIAVHAKYFLTAWL